MSLSCIPRAAEASPAQSLASLFLAHVPHDRRARFAAVPDLEAALEGLADAGQGAWPEIPLSPTELVAFLGPVLPAEAAADLASLRAGELHLVCAYSLGVRGAADALEAHYLSRVAAALGRLRTPPATIADIQQDLRQRLVEMRTSPGVHRGYSGRGDLCSWLCVSAVRAAGRRRERGMREQPLQEIEDLLVSPDHDPEMQEVRTTYRREMRAALQEALAALTSRERNVLHYHFVERLSIDDIGALYGVHRATAARWIERTREAVSQRTREILAQRVSLSQAGFRRMLSLIESQIGVVLGSPPAAAE
jgi:RNA polymerase sigma-70 factor, ECF subfamily